MIRTSSAAPEARGRPRLLGLFSLAALVAVTLASQTAQASIVHNLNATTEFDGGIGVMAHYSGAVNFNVNTEAGRFTTTWNTASPTNPFGNSGDSFLTYCVDISTFLQGNQSFDAQVSVLNGTNIDGKSINRDLGAAGWVFNTFSQQGMTDASWLSMLQGLPVTGGALASLTMMQAHAALQLAVWEAAYDPNGGKSGNLGYLGGGALTFSGKAVDLGNSSNPKNSNVVKLTNYILDARFVADPAGATSAVGFINYPPNGLTVTGTKNQDQLFYVSPEDPTSINPVPEPSTLVMGAVGVVIGLGAVWRRNRKNRQAVEA